MNSKYNFIISMVVLLSHSAFAQSFETRWKKQAEIRGKFILLRNNNYEKQNFKESLRYCDSVMVHPNAQKCENGFMSEHNEDFIYKIKVLDKLKDYNSLVDIVIDVYLKNNHFFKPDTTTDNILKNALHKYSPNYQNEITNAEVKHDFEEYKKDYSKGNRFYVELFGARHYLGYNEIGERALPHPDYLVFDKNGKLENFDTDAFLKLGQRIFSNTLLFKKYSNSFFKHISSINYTQKFENGMETVLNCSNGRLNFYTYVKADKVIRFENSEIIQPLLDKIELLLQNQQKENWITMEKLDRSKTRLTINNEYSTYEYSQEIENMLNEYIEKMRGIAK